MSATELGPLLAARRIVVCVGTGGVGKTTVSAALAVAAARRGRRVLVLTIDPARRLADALGLEALPDVPTALPAHVNEQLGIAEGRLEAMMLDMKSTFDGLVERFAPDPRSRARILENRIYQHVSDALAGSSEYAAMEKVYELSEAGHFDLIVLDTPPSQHALDFLESPQRLVEFLNSNVVQLLLHPAMAAGRFGFKLFQRTASRVLALIERVSGVSFLEDISEFLLAFEGMSEGFVQRATRVRELLLGPDAAFVLVAGPSREAARGASEFLTMMAGTGVPVAAVLVNRVRVWPGGGDPPEALLSPHVPVGDVEALAEALAAARPGEPPEEATRAADAAVAVASGYASLVQLDVRNTALLAERAARQGLCFARIPELRSDVGDAAGLLAIGAVVLPEAEAAAEAAAEPAEAEA